MSKVAVSLNVLKWALERGDLAVDDLKQKFPKIQEWMIGEILPTLKQLDSLSKATMTPLGFFFLDEPPEERLPIPHFRTLGDSRENPSPELLETIQAMQRRQLWIREYYIEEGKEKLQFVNSVRFHEETTSIAQRLRDLLNFDDEWAAKQSSWTEALRTLHETMDDVGILVVVNGIVGNNAHRKLDPGEFRGFVLVDEFAPLVFVNGKDGKAAQMFTLAHELAHIFFGSSAAFDLREMQAADDPVEQACNRVAAEFLVPEMQLRSIWPSIKNKSNPFQLIARHFKVSNIVAARRALDLSLINKTDFFEFYDKYQKEQHRVSAKKTEGGDFYLNQNFRVGKRFATAVIQAAREGKLLFSEAYNLTGLYGKTFDEYASSLLIRNTQ